MKDNSALNLFPKLQIKPFDGMTVTAETWAQAHAEHRSKLQAHELIFHGSGIVSGLQVIANDPPDHYVFISPGLAVDPAGNVIVLTEPVAFDFGDTMEGELLLVLGHGEREVAGDQNDIRYIQNEFVIAARPGMPKRPAVELARITLSSKGAAVKNTQNPVHPGIDEIDTRYRSVVRIEEKETVCVGICRLGEKTPPEILAGWDSLAEECKRSTPYDLVIDDQLPICAGLQKYSIVYLAGAGSFNIEAKKVKELADYLSQGKKIIAEALDTESEQSFNTLFESLNVKLKAVAENDAILKTPYCFNTAPEGNQGSQVFLGKNVVYSTAKYTLAWNGKVNGGTGSRSDIRSAQEWGINIISSCL